MTTHPNRGEITLAIVLVCALATVAGVGGFKFGKQSGKAETTKEHIELETKTALAVQAAKDSAAATDAAVAANTLSTAKSNAKEQAAAGFVAGAGMALEREPNPSVYVRSAQLFNKISADTLPTITSKQKAEFSKILEELLDKEALISASLDAKEKEAGELKSQAATAQSEAASANVRAADYAKKIVELNQQVQAQATVVTSLTAEKDTLWDRIKRIAWIVGGLWVLSLILPLLSKAIPALKPLATVFGSVWSPGVQMLKTGAEKLTEKADNLKADLIALQEFTKTKMASRFNGPEMQDFKKEVKNWWEGDLESQNEVERIKARTLRA